MNYIDKKLEEFDEIFWDNYYDNDGEVEFRFTKCKKACKSFIKSTCNELIEKVQKDNAKGKFYTEVEINEKTKVPKEIKDEIRNELIDEIIGGMEESKKDTSAGFGAESYDIGYNHSLKDQIKKLKALKK